MKREFRFSYVCTLDTPNEASPLTRYSLCFLGDDIEKRFENKSPRNNLSFIAMILLHKGPSDHFL